MVSVMSAIGKASGFPDQESTAERMLATRFSCTQFLVVNDRLAHWRGSAPRLPCAKGAVAKRLRDCAVKRLILTTNQRKGTVKDTVRSDDR